MVLFLAIIELVFQEEISIGSIGILTKQYFLRFLLSKSLLWIINRCINKIY